MPRCLWSYVTASSLAGLVVVRLARRALVLVEVEGQSMAPTLSTGDHVLVLRMQFSRPVRPGDVVAARMPDSYIFPFPASAPHRCNWVVKRVAAIENEELPPGLGQADTRVPAKHVFLLGDAPRSYDSKHWGPIPSTEVLGRAIWRIPSQFTSRSSSFFDD